MKPDAFSFYQSRLSDIAGQAGVGGIGGGDIHLDLTAGMIKISLDICCAVGVSVLLHTAPDGGQVMVGGLHGPDFITLRGKSFFRVAFHTHINEQGEAVFVDDKASGVVVAVAFAVTACFYSQKINIVPGDEKPCAGIVNVRVADRRSAF